MRLKSKWILFSLSASWNEHIFKSLMVHFSRHFTIYTHIQTVQESIQSVQFSSVTWLCSVQSLGCVQLFATPWTAAHQASLSITNSWSLLKLMSIELVIPSNHLILCHPLLLICHPLLLPPSIFLSSRVFSNESILLIKWPKYWSFSFSISPSNEYSGLISFRIDWLASWQSKGLLRVLPNKHHSSKASILWCSAFFIVQLSHPYMTIGKP